MNRGNNKPWNRHTCEQHFLRMSLRHSHKEILLVRTELIYFLVGSIEMTRCAFSNTTKVTSASHQRLNPFPHVSLLSFLFTIQQNLFNELHRLHGVPFVHHALMIWQQLGKTTKNTWAWGDRAFIYLITRLAPKNNKSTPLLSLTALRLSSK
jgi:hypothetical protein